MRLLLFVFVSLLIQNATAQSVPTRLTNFPNGEMWSMSGVPTTLTVFDNKLFFQVYTPQNGSRIYAYDGAAVNMLTSAGGFGDNGILYYDDAFVVAGGKMFFLVMNGNGRGHQLHVLLPNGLVIPCTYQGGPLRLDHVPVAVGNYLYWRHWTGGSSLPVLRRMDVFTGTITDLYNPQNICPASRPVASQDGDRLFFSTFKSQPPLYESTLR